MKKNRKYILTLVGIAAWIAFAYDAGVIAAASLFLIIFFGNVHKR